MPLGIYAKPAGTTFTVTVAAMEFTLPEIMLTRTQKLVVEVSAGGVKLDEFVPTGVVVVPAVP
jgi:hypothetical protein